MPRTFTFTVTGAGHPDIHKLANACLDLLLDHREGTWELRVTGALVQTPQVLAQAPQKTQKPTISAPRTALRPRVPDGYGLAPDQ